MKIYGIKNCDTVKKALTFLKDNDIEHTFVDLKINTLSTELTTAWAKKLGINILINKKSATYRALNDKEKESLSLNTLADIIAQNQSIMKRPIIVYTNGDITVGFNNTIKDKISE